MAPSVTFQYGFWQESAGYFNVEERLVKAKAPGLTLPLASMPSYAGGQVGEPVGAWVRRRLGAFPALPQLAEYV